MAVAIDLIAVIDGTTLSVRGATTLVDGSVVDCEASYVSGSAEGYVIFMEPAAAPVASGAFECHADLVGRFAGTIRGYAKFEPFVPVQPENVRSTYGPRGEHLGGEHVAMGSDGWVVETTSNEVDFRSP